MSAARKPHPVPLPATWEQEQKIVAARRGAYTSIRVSHVTRALLERMRQEAQAQLSSHTGRRYWRTIGMDELLYCDALQRLGELPLPAPKVKS